MGGNARIIRQLVRSAASEGCCDQSGDIGTVDGHLAVRVWIVGQAVGRR